ncbi:hypothetical protein GGR54DRAFT_474467 [Hypoxylon sp. NC1633]|nr:hypothetical protein GGR54DRAFT_474467 [Hypoxylon sp. NC1633]
MSPPSQTPVKVPTSAANYTPATLDADLRSQINILLIREGHIDKIQDHLLHALNAHPSNWPSAVQTHALALLRSGDVTTFPALVRRVLEDVRHETFASSTTTTTSAVTNGETTNGASINGNGTTATTNGNGNGSSKAVVVNGTGGADAAATAATAGAAGGLAIPQAVVDAVLKVARECLDAVCEIDDGATAG